MSNDTCPNCGYCKHCGRGAQPTFYPQPYYVPPNYVPWYQQPNITWGGSQTVATGGYHATNGIGQTFLTGMKVQQNT